MTSTPRSLRDLELRRGRTTTVSLTDQRLNRSSPNRGCQGGAAGWNFASFGARVTAKAPHNFCEG